MPDGHLESGDLSIDSNGDTDQIVLASPILSVRLLSAIASALRKLADDHEPRPVILCSSHPSVFLAGADLREIATLDTARSGDYAHRGRSIVELLEAYPAPTVAAVAGSCAGGGFDIVMACDAVVAGPTAYFEHPGIYRGLVTGWSGTVNAPSVFGSAMSRALLIEGRRLTAEAALSLGLVGHVCTDPVLGAAEKARELARLPSSRLWLWRQLRGRRFVDRFRASVVHKL